MHQHLIIAYRKIYNILYLGNLNVKGIFSFSTIVNL